MKLLPEWLNWAENVEESRWVHATTDHGDWCHLTPRMCAARCMADSVWAVLTRPYYAVAMRLAPSRYPDPGETR